MCVISQTSTSILTSDFYSGISTDSLSEQDLTKIKQDGIRISTKKMGVLKSIKKSNPLMNYTNLGKICGTRNSTVSKFQKNGRHYVIKSALHQGQEPNIRGLLKEASIHFLAANKMPEKVVKLHKAIVTSEQVHFIQELGANSLSQLIKDGQIRPLDLIKIGYLLEKRLQELHEVGIAHKDMHAGNILLNLDPQGDWQLTIIDFGASSMDMKDIESEKDLVPYALKDFVNQMINTPKLFQSFNHLDRSVIGIIKKTYLLDHQKSIDWLDSVSSSVQASLSQQGVLA